jgi:uncharacterized protein YjbI with pentapeptide repeats
MVAHYPQARRLNSPGGADLSDANLSGAVLFDANLSDANLSRADLSGARGITEEQLEEQAKTLKDTTMPNGLVHP